MQGIWEFRPATSGSGKESGTLPRHQALGGQYHVPDFKSRSKSRAASLSLQFLNMVFASEGASRFFKTFLTRFMFDSSANPDDSSGTPRLVAAL